MGNWIVLGILLVLVCMSTGVLRRQRKKGGCGCGCTGCFMNCTEKERQERADDACRTKEEKKK